MYDGPWDDLDYEEPWTDDEDEDEAVLRPMRVERNPDVYLPFAATCPTCGFTSADIKLLQNHSCDVQQNGGRCEDYPCCGHEAGDCNGLRYGSDEAIKAEVYRAAHDPEFAYRMERQAEYDEQWGY